MCAARAAGGRSGLSISHSCVEVSFRPSGWLMLMGFVVGLILTAGAPGCKNVPVAPASAIATSFGISIVWVASNALCWVDDLLSAATVISSSSSSKVSAKIEKTL